MNKGTCTFTIASGRTLMRPRVEGLLALIDSAKPIGERQLSYVEDNLTDYFDDSIDEECDSIGDLMRVAFGRR